MWRRNGQGRCSSMPRKRPYFNYGWARKGAKKIPIPKPFVLIALTACTGMDMVFLLRKAGKQVRDFRLSVEGEISKQPPVEYTGIHLICELNGEKNLQEDVLNAITNSQENICGVSNMLKNILSISWQILYNGSKFFVTEDTWRYKTCLPGLPSIDGWHSFSLTVRKIRNE